VDARERYDELADFLTFRYDDVELSRMMGMACVKARGKIVAGFTRGAMVFKLTDLDRRTEALALEGAHLFDPSGRGRPFREWVVVPAEHAGRWETLAEHALKPSA
jgi:hypothetical protein